MSISLFIITFIHIPTLVVYTDHKFRIGDLSCKVTFLSEEPLHQLRSRPLSFHILLGLYRTRSFVSVLVFYCPCMFFLYLGRTSPTVAGGLDIKLVVLFNVIIVIYLILLNQNMLHF